MRSILITGGAGFIGIETANALADTGHDVRVLDSLDPQVHAPGAKRPDRLSPDVEFIRGDVRDADMLRRALHRIDTVYCMAAITGTAQSAYEGRRYVDVNGCGMALLWDTIVEQRLSLERLILASSRAVYGEGAYDCASCGRVAPPSRSAAQLDAGQWEPVCPRCNGPLQPVPTAETHIGQAGSVYATTKLLQEQLCRHGSQVTGIPTIVLRYFNVIGAHQSMHNPYCGITSIFCARLLAGLPIQLYEDGAIERDFIGVPDVVLANRRALELPAASHCLNIGSGRAVRLSTIADMLCEIMHVAPASEVTGFSRLGDIRRCIADTGAAERAMGFRASADIGAALTGIAEWAQRQERNDGRYQAMLSELTARSVLRRQGRPAR